MILKSLLAVAVFVVMTASQSRAAIIEQLVLDAGGGTIATINVDDLGVTSCTDPDCAGLIFPAFVSPHSTLLVTGTLGQFTINITGIGGADAISPTLQNLNQVQASTTSAGTLSAFFTDTDYCLGGGGCLGPSFVFSVSTVNDTAISTSTTDFAAFADAGNAIPAGTLIGSFSGLTGLSDSAAGVFANPIGSSGSLSTATIISFSGAGTVQANAQFSSAVTGVPEPGTLSLLGFGGMLAFYTLRRKRP
jgi:hypothetical protein